MSNLEISSTVPGVPTILNRLVDKINVLYLPCISEYKLPQIFEGVKNVDVNINKFDSIIPEPYENARPLVFAGIEKYFGADCFFEELLRRGENYKNIVAYSSRLQDVSQINKILSKEVEKAKEGNYLFLLYPDRVKIALLDSYKELRGLSTYLRFEYSIKQNVNYVFAHIVEPWEFCKESSVIDHHTLHTYEDYRELNPNGIKGVLESSAKLANIQICNLHNITTDKSYVKKDKFDLLSIKRIREAVESVGFDSILFAEIQNINGETTINENIQNGRYRIHIKKLNDVEEIEDVETGNFKWLVLKNNS